MAIETQSLSDVNSEIIANLASADYYVFIDFAREQVCGTPQFIGSLFTHQELAIAYILKFDRALFLRQKGVRLEGLGKYLLSNAKTFSDVNDVVKVIKMEVSKRAWTPSYSRHLNLVRIRKPRRAYHYTDHSSTQKQYIWLADIKNGRGDKPARNCLGFLWRVTDVSAKKVRTPDKANLKWAGRKDAYSAFIRPNDSQKIDLFAISYEEPQMVFLHSDRDIYPRRPIINKAVICAALWPDPGDEPCPPRFRTEAARLMREFKDRRGGKPYDWDDGVELRKALLDFIADFANWDNSTNKDYRETSRALTQDAGTCNLQCPFSLGQYIAKTSVSGFRLQILTGVHG